MVKINRIFIIFYFINLLSISGLADSVESVLTVGLYEACKADFDHNGMN